MSTRIALILQLTAKFTIKIIQVDAPTSDEIDMFYEDFTKAIKQNPASYTIICRDFNTKIGLKSDPSEVALGNFGSLDRNEHGKMLLSFLLEWIK